MPDIDPTKSELPVSFCFSVSLDGSGTEDASFQEVSGIEAQLPVEEVTEEGENRFKYKLPPSLKFANLVLKRGMVHNGSSLARWCSYTLNGGLSKAVTTKTITVSLLGPAGDKLVSWHLINAYPVKWEVAELSSQEGMLAVETMEFSYSSFERN